MSLDCRKLLHDTTVPYETVPYEGIEYSTCRDFDRISRYRRLRQVIHHLGGTSRFTNLETQNAYDYSTVDFEYYTVSEDRVNRLDLISWDYYGTPDYAWVIAYVNSIQDGYTVLSEQVLAIPRTVTELFKSGSVLASVPATSLNLGTA